MSRRKVNIEDYLPKSNEYKLSLKRIISLFLGHIGLFLSSLFIIIISPRDDSSSFGTAFLMFSVFMLFHSLPALMICVNYLRQSRMHKIIFDHKEKTLTIFTNDGENIIRFDEIRKIVHFYCDLYRDGFFLSKFTYSELSLHNGEKIYITSILIDQHSLSLHLPRRGSYEGMPFPFI